MRVTRGKRGGSDASGRNGFFNGDRTSWLPGSPLWKANFSSHITALGQTAMIGWSTKMCARVCLCVCD